MNEDEYHELTAAIAEVLIRLPGWDGLAANAIAECIADKIIGVLI